MKRCVTALTLALALAGPAVAIADCPGVRPGALVESPAGFCTMNFAFRGEEGARYVGTAGHCILPESTGGEETWGKKGPKARDADGRPIGRFAYAVLQVNGGEKDFSLIRLSRGIKPNASICRFGGPTGINTEISSRTQTLDYYGNGTVVGELLPARQLLALGLPNPDHVFATGVATPGDSGGPVIDRSGRAVGVLVSGGILLGGTSGGGSDNGTVGVTRIGPQIQRAQKKLGDRLRLLTAPTR